MTKTERRRRGILRRACTAFIAAAILLSASCGGDSADTTQDSTTSASPDVTSASHDGTSAAETAPESSCEPLPAPEGAAVLTDFAQYSDGGRDWAPAFEKAFGVSDTVYVPEGEYSSSAIVLASGKTLCGAGKGSVLKQLPEADRLFHIMGSRNENSALAADKADFSDSFTITKRLDLKPGDTVYLLGQRNAMLLEDDGREWCLGRSYASGTACFYSEFLTVKSAEADGAGMKVITGTPSLFPFYYADGSRESEPLKPTVSGTDWPYMRSATVVYKMNFASDVTIRDMSVKNARGNCLYAAMARNVSVSRLYFTSPETSVPEKNMSFVRLLDCLDCCVSDCTFDVPVRPDPETLRNSDGFGLYNMIKILSCQSCGLLRCSLDYGTHPITVAKKHKEGVSVGCYVKDCTVRDAVWSGIWISQGCYNTEVSGNTVVNCNLGIMTAARKTLISGNTVTGPGKLEKDFFYLGIGEGGTAGITLTEGYSFDCVIRDNVISNVDTGLLIRDGYEKTNIFEGGNVLFTGNTVTFIRRSTFTWRNTHNRSAEKVTVTAENNAIAKQS